MLQSFVEFIDPLRAEGGLMSTKHSLAAALTTLLDASTRDNKWWAVFFDCPAETIESWRTGAGIPSDHQMTSLLRECDRTQGSKANPDLPKAITTFWDFIEQCETNRSTELPLEPGETVPQRLTRFTNQSIYASAWRNIHLIPARNRKKFFDEVVEIFNKHVKPGY